MIRLLSAAAIGALIPAAAGAQAMDHSAHAMSEPTAPTTKAPAKDPHAGHRMPAPDKPATPAPADDPHAGHQMPAPKNPETPPPADDPHAGHQMPAAPAPDRGGHGTGGTALPAGTGTAPVPPAATYADSVWGAEAMAASRRTLRREHGGSSFSQIMFDLAEYQIAKGRDGARWDAEGWFGGDINRLVIKSEGEARFGDGVEHAEIQALYSRAIDPYFNLQAGVRYDIRPDPSRVYATIGVEGLAPYWFEVDAALFLSNKGDLLARIGGYYDQRITQRLILQPRAELNFAAQDVPETGTGSGLSDVELGLRLRYEVKREFAPYIGINWTRSVGDTVGLLVLITTPSSLSS